MQIYIEKDYDALSHRAAEHIAARIREKRPFVLGCATGGTPQGLYRELARMVRSGLLDFNTLSTVNLDEYCGIDENHPQSYRFFMRQHFFLPAGIDFRNSHFPACDARSCAAFEKKITELGGIDLQILGLGKNGHIGFNEPGSLRSSRTRIVTLSLETREDNARFFETKGDVPHSAATMGIATILDAREIVLLASGEHKARAVFQMIRGAVHEAVPASFLQEHPRVLVFLDAAASKEL